MANEEEVKDKETTQEGGEEEKKETAPETAEEKAEEKLAAAQEAEKKEETVKESKPEEKSKEPEKKEKPAPTGKHADLIKEIEKMSVADLNELVKALEERFGVAAAPVAVAPAAAGSLTAPGAPAEAGAAPAGKATYIVHLSASGDQKINVIKALREIRPDLGLKEAKDLVDGAPKDVAQNMPAEDAQKAKEKLEAVGAKVELK